MTKFVQIDKGRDNMIKNFINRMLFIKKAFQTTKDEMLISLGIILVLTCILSVVFYIVESIAQPDVYRNFWDALVWAYTRYMEGGDGVFEGVPVTVVGKVIASLLGIIGIAIVAIPAGLVGSGFMDAIAEEKREKELAEMRHRMLKQFPRFVSPAFNSYRKTLEASTEWEKARFTTRAQLMSRFQTRLGMDFKDIADVCTRYPEFSLRDIAKEQSDEDNQQSTFWIELLPKNRPYGCCIDRGSKVTIVSTSGHTEPATGWLAYHIAKLGGFNYVAKDIESDPDNPTTYYNVSDVNACPNLPLFIEDINRLSAKEGSWVIPILGAIGLLNRPTQIHFCYNSTKHDDSYDDPNSRVTDYSLFDKMYNAVSEELEKEYGYKSDKNEWYAIGKNNIAHHIVADNVFTIRVECRVWLYDARFLSIIKSMSEKLHDTLEPEKALVLPPEMVTRPKGKDFGMADYVN